MENQNNSLETNNIFSKIKSWWYNIFHKAKKERYMLLKMLLLAKKIKVKKQIYLTNIEKRMKDISIYYNYKIDMKIK